MKKGVAFVETKNLDGESNLKHKEVPKDFHNLISNTYNKELLKLDQRLSLSFLSPKELNMIMNSLFGTITCDIPNAEMYNFDGLMCIDSSQLLDESRSTNTALFNLTYHNLLLRGSSLKNTEYIYGIVVNAGHYSKIMLNSLQSRNKQSKLSSLTNSQLQIVIIIELVICIVLTFFFSIIKNPFVIYIY